MNDCGCPSSIVPSKLQAGTPCLSDWVMLWIATGLFIALATAAFGVLALQ
jgi:hypothetical protein